jgi:hypothetical protein
MNNIDFMQRYLSYDFIHNNLDLFLDRPIQYLYSNKSFTINNILNIIDKYTCYNLKCIFSNANITLDEIINNNLHNNEYFYYYAKNINCIVNNILTHSDLNWNYEKLNEHLSLNCHDYNNSEYIFKFAD